MNAQPLVTIGLPVYNAEKTIADAIRSVLAQTYANWELLLLDDGSKDRSWEVVRGFADPRIQWISDGCNRGISYRLNQGVALSKGRYFCRMDADDICFATRLERQVDLLSAKPEIDLLATSIVTFDTAGDLKGVVEVAREHADICRRPWNGFHFPHPSWMGKIDWFRLHPYTSAADGAEDQFLLYQSCDDSFFAGTEEVLLAYRDDRTSFKKLYGRRMAFWRVIARAAWARARMKDLCLVTLRQPLKILADFLHVKYGVAGARNNLLPVTPAIRQAWGEMSLDVNENR